MKVILVYVAITTLIAFVVPSSQSPPRPGSSVVPSSTIWDYQHSLLRPTYPPRDVQGNYLSPYKDQLASDGLEKRRLRKSLEAVRADAQERMAQLIESWPRGGGRSDGYDASNVSEPQYTKASYLIWH